jgi:hypothetical protein
LGWKSFDIPFTYSDEFRTRTGQVFRAINKTSGKWETTQVNWQGRPDYGEYSTARFDPTCLASSTFGCIRWYYENAGSGPYIKGMFPGYDLATDSFPASDYTRLKQAPCGMGWLLYTGALPDARSFYCPSAMDQSWKPSPYDLGQTANMDITVAWPDGWNQIECGKMNRFDPVDANKWWNTYTSAVDTSGKLGGGSCGQPFYDWGLAPPQDSLRSWYNAGGTDGDILVHGNWPRHAAKAGANGYATYGQYMYRNQEIHSRGNDRYSHRGADDTYSGQPAMMWGVGYDCVGPMTVVFTDPKVVSAPGCPAFKTPRQLGNHALVSDSWQKSTIIEKPGFGGQAHKDGYNVLYGNYATRWFGDPAGSIMYWVGREGRLYEVEGWTNWYHPGLWGTKTLWMSAAHEVYNSEINPTMIGHYASLEPLVWHNLDTVMDVDKGANTNLYYQGPDDPWPSKGDPDAPSTGSSW